MKERLPCFGIVLFAVAPCDNDLQAQTETEAEHIDSQIPNPGKGGCAQFYFSHMPQENGISDIDKLFDKDAHHYRKVDEPNMFICIVHCST